MRNATRGTARREPSGTKRDYSRALTDDIDGIDRENHAGRAEIAGYIAQLTAEMSHMAERAGFETLSYFLSMARLEAEMERRRLKDET